MTELSPVRALFSLSLVQTGDSASFAGPQFEFVGKLAVTTWAEVSHISAQHYQGGIKISHFSKRELDTADTKTVLGKYCPIRKP